MAFCGLTNGCWRGAANRAQQLLCCSPLLQRRPCPCALVHHSAPARHLSAGGDSDTSTAFPLPRAHRWRARARRGWVAPTPPTAAIRQLRKTSSVAICNSEWCMYGWLQNDGRDDVQKKRESGRTPGKKKRAGGGGREREGGKGKKGGNRQNRVDLCLLSRLRSRLLARSRRLAPSGAAATPAAASAAASSAASRCARVAALREVRAVLVRRGALGRRGARGVRTDTSKDREETTHTNRQETVSARSRD